MLSISSSDIETVLEPYVLHRYENTDPAWQREVHALRKGGWVRLWQARIRNFIRGSTKRVERVRHDYSGVWSQQQIPGAPAVEAARYLMRWGDRGLEVRGWAEKRVHMLLLHRALSSLRPANVLEVGSGNGLVLMMLATGHPEIRFQGVELTQAGVDAARQLQSEPALPPAVTSSLPFTPVDPGAFRRVEFRQGNAAALPWPEASFDLAITSLALEQMERVKREALSELARVARKWVVMLEPFRDFNRAPEQVYYTRAKEYLSAAVDDLPTYGLRPLQVFDDFPSKVNRGVGLVLAEPVRGTP